jgi:hypothetical protein
MRSPPVVLTVPAVHVIALAEFSQMSPLPEATFAPTAMPFVVVVSVTVPLPSAEMPPFTERAPGLVTLMAALDPPEVERLGAPALTVAVPPAVIVIGLEKTAVSIVTAPVVAFPIVIELKPG